MIPLAGALGTLIVFVVCAWSWIKKKLRGRPCSMCGKRMRRLGRGHWTGYFCPRCLKLNEPEPVRRWHARRKANKED